MAARLSTVSTIRDDQERARIRAGAFLRCRTFGHSWHDYDSDWKSTMGTPLTLRCERCDTERRDTISPSTGALITRHYYYSDDYQYERGASPTRDDFRRLLLARRIEEAREARRATTARKRARDAS